MAITKGPGPQLPIPSLYEAAGIDPKTGAPIRFSAVSGTQLKVDTRRFLRIIDEQRAVNRYKWFNLPCNLSSQELERMLYYKGHLCFFYMEQTGEFYFMPYALTGTIDFYGRYNEIHPVPMTSGEDKEEESKAYKSKAELLSTLKLKVVKEVIIYKEDLTEDKLTKSAVILRDYTNQLPQQVTPRYMVNDELINCMADCVPFLRTSLLLGTGVKGMRVPDADSASEVKRAACDMYKSAISGNPYVAITSSIEFQDLQSGSALKSEEFMLAMQSLDNLLLAGYGIDNGGLFEKKSHILEAEAQVNGGPVGLVLQDGLAQRQSFCNIVNSIWNLGIWCELSDTITNLDTDGNGTPYDDDQQSAQTGSNPVAKEGGNE